MASIKQRKSSFSVIYWYLDSAGVVLCQEKVPVK